MLRREPTLKRLATLRRLLTLKTLPLLARLCQLGIAGIVRRRRPISASFAVTTTGQVNQTGA
jgi:hypothetical protein